ncbi:MAG: UDP-N-acetylmuramoyl-tripeptide--D-alanyl-D-alanine ligase, partial [Sedimentisphaerales bacterium]
GDCFFAIPGENFDGHDYVPEAFAKGAVCAVVSKDVSSCVVRNASCEENTQYAIRDTQYVILRVVDTVKALGEFAKEYRRQAGFKVVAITGSVGKTMTRQITYHVLSQHFRVFASPKNYNNQIGLPLTLLSANPEHQIVIAELGTNHPGEIAYLSRIAQPDIAVVTNVHPAHLEGFGDLQTIVREKLSISEGLSKDGVLIINADVVKWLNGNQLNYQLPVTNNQIITFGRSDDADYWVQKVTYNRTGCSFTINGTEIYLPVLGMGNVENALAGWAVCSRFGLTIKDFARAVRNLRTVPMRAELVQVGTLTVLNDCYNANPASMKNALDILRHLDPDKKRRLVFICGDMAELGQQTEQRHAELGASIVQAKVQVLLAVGKFAKVAAESAKKIADYNLQAICFADVFSACNNLPKFIKDYDIILVKGSRAAKLEEAVEKLKKLFS